MVGGSAWSWQLSAVWIHRGKWGMPRARGGGAVAHIWLPASRDEWLGGQQGISSWAEDDPIVPPWQPAMLARPLPAPLNPHLLPAPVGKWDSHWEVPERIKLGWCFHGGCWLATMMNSVQSYTVIPSEIDNIIRACSQSSFSCTDIDLPHPWWRKTADAAFSGELKKSRSLSSCCVKDRRDKTVLFQIKQLSPQAVRQSFKSPKQ